MATGDSDSVCTSVKNRVSILNVIMLPTVLYTAAVLRYHHEQIFRSASLYQHGSLLP